MFASLITQLAMCMRCVVLSSGPVRLYSILPHYLTTQGLILGKKNTEHNMCVLIFSTNFETFFILRKIRRDIIII
jgi:hypothetical protein